MRVRIRSRIFDWEFDRVFDRASERARLSPSIGQGGMMQRVLLLSPEVISCRAMKKSVNIWKQEKAGKLSEDLTRRV